ncbi:MAG TPA: hypothetical protein VNH18_33300 [Bryobacteraceae bacterium]|nr:hypothetical protein [Bryobacteraceae bacterium]
MAELWERQPTETLAAWASLRVYLALGAERSLAKVLTQKGTAAAPVRKTSLTRLKVWSRKWNWVERARAYDDYNDRILKTALETAAQKQALIWQKRDEELRSSQYQQALRAIAKAETALDFPLATVTKEETAEGGRTILRTVVKPMRWSLLGAFRMSEAAHRMARAAIRNDGHIKDGNSDLREENWQDEDFRISASPAAADETGAERDKE